MQRVWNYLFYCTWRLGSLIDKVSAKLFGGSLIWILQKYIPSNSRKRVEVLKALKYKEAKWPHPWRAFRLFGVSTLVLFLIVGDFLMTRLGVEDENRYYYTILVSVLVVYLNYSWCWKNEVYHKYFHKFKMNGYSNWDYLIALVFHFGILDLVVLSALGFEFV